MNIDILNGDCLEMMATLPDESVDCVVTSPPYWGLRDYGGNGRVWGAPECVERGELRHKRLHGDLGKDLVVEGNGSHNSSVVVD